MLDIFRVGILSPTNHLRLPLHVEGQKQELLGQETSALLRISILV